MKARLFFLILFVAITPAGLLGNVKFTATANPEAVSEGKTLQITYTLENAIGRNFKAPDFKGLQRLQGPVTSQQTQISGGRVISSVSYTYVLKAPNKGEYQIPSATIVVDGKKIKSNSLTIMVVEPSEAEKIERKNAKEAEQRLKSEARQLLRENIYMKLYVSDGDVYQNEQIVASYKLYISDDIVRRISQNSTPKSPVLSGFFTEEVEIPNQGYSSEIIGGKHFKTMVLKKVILMPQKSGRLTVDEMSIELSVRLRVSGRQRSRSPYDNFFDDPFFNGSTYRDFDYVVKSNTEKIEVKPLPEGAPASFNGAVGKFSMSSSLNKNKTKTNEPVALKLKISGKGNLNLIEPPELGLPKDIEYFDPKTKDNISVTSSGITGSRVYEYLLIPRYAGDYDIEPVEFTYFDTRREKYITLSSKPFTLEVAQGAQSASPAAASARENLEYGGKDIRYIKENTDLNKSGGKFFGSPVFYALSGAPFILGALLLAFMKKRRELEQDETLMKSRKASKIARGRLSKAKIHLSNSSREDFYSELDKALWGYISYKLNIPASALGKDTALAELQNRGIGSESAERYIAIIGECEFARYAPSAGGDNQMAAAYNEAENLISEFEEKLK